MLLCATSLSVSDIPDIECSYLQLQRPPHRSRAKSPHRKPPHKPRGQRAVKAADVARVPLPRAPHGAKCPRLELHELATCLPSYSYKQRTASAPGITVFIVLNSSPSYPSSSRIQCTTPVPEPCYTHSSLAARSPQASRKWLLTRATRTPLPSRQRMPSTLGSARPVRPSKPPR